MKKIVNYVFATCVGAAALFTSCSRDVVTPAVRQDATGTTYGSVRYSVSIQVQTGATAGNRSTGLVDATVSLSQGGNVQTKKIDEKGIVTFDNLPEGRANWIVNPGVADLATATGVVDLNTVAVNNKDGRDAHVAVVVKLPTLTAGLTGTVFGDFDFNARTPESGRAGVTVRLEYAVAGTGAGTPGYTYLPNVYTTTTDASGKYSFTGVPATNNISDVSATLTMFTTVANQGLDVVFTGSTNPTAQLRHNLTRDLGITKITPSFVNNATVTGRIVGDFDLNVATEESGLAGIEVFLDYSQVTGVTLPVGTYSTTTDANGLYTFVNVPAFIGTGGGIAVVRTSYRTTVNNTPVVFGNGSGNPQTFSFLFNSITPSQVYTVDKLILKPNLNLTATVSGVFFGDFGWSNTFGYAVANTLGDISATQVQRLRALGIKIGASFNGDFISGYGSVDSDPDLANVVINIAGALSTISGVTNFNGYELVNTTPGSLLATVSGADIVVFGNQTIIGYTTLDVITNEVDTVWGTNMDLAVLLDLVEPKGTQARLNNDVKIRKVISVGSTGTVAFTDRAIPSVSRFLVAGVRVTLTLNDFGVPGYDIGTKFIRTTNANGAVSFDGLPVKDGGAFYNVETEYIITVTNLDGVTKTINFNAPTATSVFALPNRNIVIGSAPVRVNFNVL